MDLWKTVIFLFLFIKTIDHFLFLNCFECFQMHLLKIGCMINLQCCHLCYIQEMIKSNLFRIHYFDQLSQYQLFLNYLISHRLFSHCYPLYFIFHFSAISFTVSRKCFRWSFKNVDFVKEICQILKCLLYWNNLDLEHYFHFQRQSFHHQNLNESSQLNFLPNMDLFITCCPLHYLKYFNWF